MLLRAVILASALICGSALADYSEPNCNGKQVIVHLFEWSWDAVANECEQYLGPKGFCGVQISPPMEHIQGPAWWTRYQPVSYKLQSRSGNRDQFANMVRRCNAAGVNVIADSVINHMSGHGSSGTGTAGSSFNGGSESYPGVPFGSGDFHQPYCEVNNYQDPNNVRNCYLVGLNDLNGGKDYVRDKIAGYMNDMASLGVKGFRVDASKHMWPGDLQAIQSRLTGDPFVVHEVIDHGTEPIHTYEYYSVGKVTEFRAGDWLKSCIKDQNQNFNGLKNFGNGLSDGLHALVFVDNHDNQRSGGVLTYKDGYLYKLAVGFLIAQDYGFKRVMSSYYFDNSDQGPPGSQPNGGTGDCGNGWVCEHRWKTVGNLVQFANKCSGKPVENWQTQPYNLGFSRGNVGFFAMGTLNNANFQTGLPAGEYCDIIQDCNRKITVRGDGTATISRVSDQEPMVAICVGCQ